MRVAHFCDSEPARSDGVSASAGLSVEVLRSAGHHVEHYHPGRVPSVPLPYRTIRLAVPWFRADPAVDLVHVHTTGPIGMAGFRLAEARGLPLVLTWHTDLLAYAGHFAEIPIGAAYCAARLGLGWTAREYLELADRSGRRHSRLLALGRAMFLRTDVVIAPSEKTAAGLTEFGELPPVRVLPTPVTLSPGIRPPPPSSSAVLSVGRVTDEKNPRLLLAAFVELLAVRPDARLIVVGVRQSRRKFLAQVRALGLSESVEVVPPVPRQRIGDYYQRADVLAFASTTDTQSLVVAEAEAAGLPVVSVDAALAARPGDPASHRVTCEPTPPALAGALARMLNDRALAERTREAGLRATAAYPPEAYLPRLLTVYAEARRRNLSRSGTLPV